MAPRTHCPRCGRRIVDPRPLSCIHCNALFADFEAEDAPILRSEKTGLVAAIQREVVMTLGRWGLLILALFTGLFGVGVVQYINHQITAKFADPNIERSFRHVADTAAQELMANAIKPEIATAKAELKTSGESFRDFLTDLKRRTAQDYWRLRRRMREDRTVLTRKMGKLSAVTERSSATVARIEIATDFMTTVMSAMTDDRRAFDRLGTWADDPGYPYSQRAHQAWVSILDAHAQPFTVSGRVFPWKEGIDPSKLTLGDLRTAYSQIDPYLRPALIEYVWSRTDIPKKDRMDFLAQVMRSDDSLAAVEVAGRFFKTEAGLKFKPLAVAPALQWWETNKETIQ